MKGMYVITFLTWIYHIWMAHEKGDWDNIWRYGYMFFELVILILCIALDKAKKRIIELKEKIK